MMTSLALTLTLVTGQLALFTPKSGPRMENPLEAKKREKQDFIEKLNRDIFKVDRSIIETERLIAKSRNAPYLPDLQFRLAELYVEKSRYLYFREAEQRPEGSKGAIVSPETQILKQRAVGVYQRLLREFPDFKDADKVTFYLAHEQREMGEFDKPPESNMLKTLGDLIRKYPSSPLRLEAEQILGDYWFDKADLKQAEDHYKAILDTPPSPVHDLARYKMGWIRINQANHAEAVTFFEAAAASAPLPGVDISKALSVKREALLDLVYSYTEARPPKGALQYFEKLSDSRTTYALALDKLGNRYFIKQQYEFAIPALRRLLEVQPDPELEVERVGKLYDSIKAAKGKVLPRPEDLGFLVRAAVQVKKDPTKDEGTRKKTLAELEEMSRDLSTTIHVQAQKKDDKTLYIEAAEAYRRYLSLFRPKQYATVMMQNRADALFSAKRYIEAARQFEELAQYLDSANKKADGADAKNGAKPGDAAQKDEKKDDKAAAAAASSPAKDKLASVAAVAPGAAGEKTLGETKSHDEALYGALLSHYSSLKPGEVERLNAFEVADARQALKLLGAQFISRYPTNEHAVEIKFNIARAYYEDGEYKKSSELFKEFALAHPTHKDATVAANLAFDSLRVLRDFKSVDEYAKAFLASALPDSFKAQIPQIQKGATVEAGDDELLGCVNDGDVVGCLVNASDQRKGTDDGAKTLYKAFKFAQTKRDRREQEIGDRFRREYPKQTTYVSDVLQSLGRRAAESGQFDKAAEYFEEMGKVFQGESAGMDATMASIRLKIAMGNHAGAMKILESMVETAGPKKADVLLMIAQESFKAGQHPKARATAEQVLKLDKTNAAAAAIVAEVGAETPGEKPEPLIAIMTTVANAPNAGGEDVAKGLWFVAEMLYRQFKAIPNDKLDDKIAALQQLQGVYQQAMSMGSAEWAVASLWRIASGVNHIVGVVEATPVPPGLKPAEIEVFRTAIKGQADQLRAQANSAFDSCIQRADSLDVYTAAHAGCRKRVDEMSSPLKGAPAERGLNVEELQKKAAASQNAADFEALGLALLGSYQVNTAMLHLNRAIELEDSRASAHNAIGYAFLLKGDGNTAKAEYNRALEADPTYDKARANVAALKCRFFDTEGARKELALVKDQASLNGPDVDPEWRSCR